MKKFIILLCLIAFPINVLAYSKYIIPGGETLGITISSDGIMVIGFYKINGKYNKGSTEIRSGDYIVKVGDTEVNDIDELTQVLEDYISDGEVELTLRRNGKYFTTELDLILDSGIYKTGLYVKSSITGIGTLSYIDDGIYGALGHEIIDSNTSNIVEIKTGEIFRNYITGIDKSTVGTAGSKNALFYYDTVYGTIVKNTNVGIYGEYSGTSEKELVEVGTPKEVELGDASIYTVLDGEEVGEYSINILKIDESASIKNILFEIIDEKLLENAGGIVQGMSGSPIMQNGKIIGVVTHVVIDNPKNGYGIFITTMLEEGDKLR